ncbi:MAG: hypothetical protein A3C55_01930 [Gammaproteobacteria bacterium RIFCSPHIGHO2_02_FULL_42_13]|nr:MAG: hypothetical protein A3C55_01930 [Gammaproteobacteria bacterium RIFCSPHIGHO2_02_FULL_42_13]OGT69847.1 MAG: hypothetical protein A3H43_02810 [Gammaproteobacteria bacterium RIFCSPLOWO2_02_FULL_42_9]
MGSVNSESDLSLIWIFKLLHEQCKIPRPLAADIFILNLFTKTHKTIKLCKELDKTKNLRQNAITIKHY